MLDLAQILTHRKQALLYRRRALREGMQGVHITIDGQAYLNFCSNDYLALAAHPRVTAALRKASENEGCGAGASHLLSGHSIAHQELECALAEYTGRQRALLFSTGYMANLGVISALAGRRDAVFMDKLNHASLLDGAHLSQARLQRYRHADTAQLARFLEQGGGERKIVASDGVFSMDGDTARLPALVALCRGYDALLMIDDAHGLGVLGENGGGTCEYYGLGESEVPVLVGTLGKAFGVFGAFAAGSETLIEFLIQFARSYIYTTALPPALAAAAHEAVRISMEETWRRGHLQYLTKLFQEGARQRNIPLVASQTPILPVVLGDSARTLAASEFLRRRGFWVGAVRPPTVPQGSARLRVTLSAAHEETQVRALLDALEEACALKHVKN